MTSRPVVVTALGIAQILGWGSSFYFPALLAAPIVADTGWLLGWVVGGVSIGLLVAGLIAPRVGAIIDKRGGRPVLAASALRLGTLFGPAQVGARVIERIFGERYHPIWTMIASCEIAAGLSDELVLDSDHPTWARII
jgi:MFS family permease